MENDCSIPKKSCESEKDVYLTREGKCTVSEEILPESGKNSSSTIQSSGESIGDDGFKSCLEDLVPEKGTEKIGEVIEFLKKKISEDDQKLEKYVPDYRVYYHRGIAKERLEMYEEAINDFEKCIDISTSSKFSLESKFAILNIKITYFKGDEEQVTKEVKKILEGDPKSSKGLEIYGKCLEVFKDFKGAIETYDEAYKNGDKEEKWSVLLRIYKYHAKHTMNSIIKANILNLVIHNADNEDPDPRNRIVLISLRRERGRVYLTLGEYIFAAQDLLDTTCAICKCCNKRDPNNVKEGLDLFDCLVSKEVGDLETALTLLKGVRKIHDQEGFTPDKGICCERCQINRINISYAEYYRARGKYKKSMRYVESIKDSQFAHTTRARILRDQGRINQAIKDYKKRIEYYFTNNDMKKEDDGFCNYDVYDWMYELVKVLVSARKFKDGLAHALRLKKWNENGYDGVTRPRVNNILGEIYYQMKDYEKSMICFKEAKEEFNGECTCLSYEGNPLIPVIDQNIKKCEEKMKTNKFVCNVCKKKCNLKCSGCGKVYYCSRKHQTFDWKDHKGKCVKK